ncbi:MAG TPA: hypothetical protein VJL87_00605, partial [Bdellovibrionota bacterium]|nr:hypothetical protein [Bdellovibrionota bacterium]
MKTITQPKRGPYLRASLVLFSTLILFTGCATYQQKVARGVGELRSGKPELAAAEFKKNAEAEGKDQLVYLFEYATALQAAGKYDESTKSFLHADRLAEFKDYHSISRVGGSLLLSEEMIQYKGENFEKVLINAFLAINYMMKRDPENALVEIRRLNEKLKIDTSAGPAANQYQSFIRYLSGLLWEDEGKWDDAYIDYEAAYKQQIPISYIYRDLIWSAQKAKREDAIQKWKARFPNEKPDPRRDDPSYGELVVIYQQGMGPQKFPNPDFNLVPKLYPRFSSGVKGKVEVEGGPKVTTEVLLDVDDVAIKTLNGAYAELIAKRLAAVATK